mgnify:CR=1 FL=1
MSQTALVITSIAGPDSSTLKIYAKECSDRNVPFIVIGDTKSPDEFDLPGCDFWSVDRQLKFNSKLALFYAFMPSMAISGNTKTSSV